MRSSFLVVVLIGTLTTSSLARLSADQVPLFRWRARVASVQGVAPTTQTFTMRLDRIKQKQAATTGDAWSQWVVFDREQAATYTGKHAYPNTHMRSFPLVTKLVVTGIVDPTTVEVEVKFDGWDTLHRLDADLFGPKLGVLISMDDGEPIAQTMAQFNRKYWKVLDAVAIPIEQRPKLFPIVDRFIGGDQDSRTWREGIAGLARGGFSALMIVPPSERNRRMAEDAGHTRTAGAVYNPPGYAFDYALDDVDAAIEAWADKQAEPFFKAGYQPNQMAMYAMSDEPGWYYPDQFEKLLADTRGMARFHQYLQEQNLSSADVGAATWDAVKPIGRWDARNGDLSAKRLFYWTMRFFAWDSSRHFARSTRALEAKFTPGTPIFTNWNFFAGRSYVPGPVANNRAKQDPNAAMGGHDWLEFGRMRGGTMLWTEDWFSDRQAYQWSFYCAKLRAAARKGGVTFGGYVIPRVAGQRDGGIIQKIASVVGHGGKGIKYFVFGPEYTFPGNCYSENIKVLPQMVTAHRMIGEAESLLYPGEAPTEKVAILMPRSAQMWDDSDTLIPNTVYDATNTHLNARTVDYMAEVFDIYLAFQHANIPVTFVEERDLNVKNLEGIAALYVTTPNLPDEYARGLADWIKAGGTLVTVAGVGHADRYDEPSTVLADALDLAAAPRDRVLIAKAQKVPASGQVTSGDESFEAFGGRSRIVRHRGEVIARFEDDQPAAVRQSVGGGQVVHFAFMPGISYWRSRTGEADGLPTGFSSALRQLIVTPARDVAGAAPVTCDTPLVETPLLTSDAGAVVTLLNWTGVPLEQCTINAAVGFRPSRVRSVLHGDQSFEIVGESVHVSLPLDEADFVLFHR